MTSYNDSIYKEQAKRVIKDIYTPGGELPETWKEHLSYTYSDGSKSNLEHIDKVEFSEDYTEKDLDRAIDYLLETSELNYMEGEDIECIMYDNIESCNESYNYSEDMEAIEYAEDDEESFSKEVYNFFRKALSSVYVTGVAEVMPYPSSENNYLATNDNATEFKGKFKGKDSPGSYDFTIRKRGDKWETMYQLSK